MTTTRTPRLVGKIGTNTPPHARVPSPRKSGPPEGMLHGIHHRPARVDTDASAAIGRKPLSEMDESHGL